MSSNSGLGFALGTFFYFGAGLVLERGLVPLLLPPNAPRLPYAQEAIFYIFVSGCLGAIGGQSVDWSKQGQTLQAVTVGTSVGIGSLLLTIFRCVHSTQP